MTALLRGMLLLLTFVPAAGALALPDDRDQPIEIRADQVELDDEAGVAIYQGDVRLDQGSVRVTADRLTIHYTAEQDVDRIVAEGSDAAGPASYHQQPEADAALIRAKAQAITYRTATEQVELTGNAELRQQDDSFSGERIVYDVRERRITASGGSDGAPVTMTIQPRSNRTDTPTDNPSESD